MCTGTSSHVVDSRDTDRLQHLNRTAAAAAAKYPLCTRLRQDVTDVLQLLATLEDATAEPCFPHPTRIRHDEPQLSLKNRPRVSSAQQRQNPERSRTWSKAGKRVLCTS